MFKLRAPFKETPAQKTAVEKLVKNLKTGQKHHVLLGVTGCGKTFLMAKVIEKLQKPALVISPNKTLCAQTYQEFKEFFPENGIHFFVSYYDYYQPEAYIPQTDTYIEKDAKINEEIDRLRHAAVQDVMTRNDVIVCASVSCIYNIGSPEDYQKVSFQIKAGQKIKRKEFLESLTILGYQRNDYEFKPSTFRVRGNSIDVFLVTGREILRVEFLGDEIEKISIAKDPFSPKYEIRNTTYALYPAHFWVTPQEKIKIAIENIKLELEEQLKKLKKQKKLLEAQRLERRTNYDLEMIQETGYCHGIENYSRHLEFRKPGEPPWTLLDYFRENPLIFIDESHLTIPQLRAMAVQDRSRKETLIEYGFRLPSAIDNRPLTFQEFNKKVDQLIYVSATPDEYEKGKALRQAQGKARKKYIVEQLIRPTGLLEPSIEIRPTKNQVKDLILEIKKRVTKKQRALVLTLTKRLAEALAEYLQEEGISCQWLHSEVKTLERPQILKELREGKYDVLVGINLLREGLDLPEVALIAILDADKEGFLRSETTLIQTMGRAARHPEGHVILYADKITKSMEKAIKEVKRRRKIQLEYNKKYKISPKPIVKPIREWPFLAKKKEIEAEFWMVRDLKLLEQEMKEAAKNLDFERAAQIRDLIREIKNSALQK
jgi:excinuclease ABC subunit B